MTRHLLAAVAAVALAANVLACPFCSTQGQTLANELASADMIVVATVVKAERDEKDYTKSRTELRIDKTIKPHPAFEKETTLVLPAIHPHRKGEGAAATAPLLLREHRQHRCGGGGGGVRRGRLPAVPPRHHRRLPRGRDPGEEQVAGLPGRSP